MLAGEERHQDIGKVVLLEQVAVVVDTADIVLVDTGSLPKVGFPVRKDRVSNSGREQVDRMDYSGLD